MMREILFRGKRMDNGNWIQGSLFTRMNEAYIIPLPIITSKAKVDSETVGQFTGLTDKNGKKLFEGDIAKYFDRFYRKTVYGAVEYRYGCYVVHTFGSPNCPAIDVVMNESDVEIIGNIHDNPELLERACE